MARVSTYVNLNRNTEEAFHFYKSIFGGEFLGDGIMRMGDVPPSPDAPEFSEEDKKLVMHVELEIIGGHVLMGSDAPESLGFNLHPGNNFILNLEPDTRIETRKLFDALASGGQVEQELSEQFWGSYYGSLTDRYGLRWMFNCYEKA
jgi:PhnB protein